MDLKTDDLINVEIDLSSELEKLNLGNIPNDFLDKISKFDEQPDIETIFLPVEEHKIKCIDEVSSKEFKSSKINTCLSDDKLCVNDPKEKDSVDVPDIKKDINGNVSIADENLNNLILKYENLELSDSDNEEDEEEVSKLTEKGPDRVAAQRRRKRDQNYLTRRDSYDRSQFNSETLRHLSGSSHVQQHETPMPNQLLKSVDFSNILSRNQTFNCVNNSTSPLDFTSVAISANISTSQNAITIPSSQNNSLYGNFRPHFLNDSLVSQNKNIIPISCSSDLLYDSASNSISSPESGYDTAYSITGSPTQNLPSPECFSDLNVENVNDQEVIDIVLDIEFENPLHSEKPVHNLIQFDLDGENPKEEILHFLKDIPSVVSEQPHTVNCEANIECVQAELKQLPPIAPLDFIETELTDLSPVISSEINCKQVPEELNDLLSAPSSETEYAQVLQELNNLSTVAEAYSILNDLPAADSYNVSCEPSPKDPRNLPLVVSSEVSCKYVSVVNNTGVIKSCTPVVPSVLCQSSQNNSETCKPVACKPLENRAKNALRKSLCDERCHAVQSAILRKINEDIQRKKEIKVIYIEDEADDKTSEKQTNLHKAVINGDIIKAYCLVEANKKYKKHSFGELNLRDKHYKTALDYAVEKKLKLLVDFLKENNACQSLNI